mmetsp:Transcript_9807/g.13521  ORF Transcript_9807/g.13521 Transcript_9807/m.13521 type:complete len:234 (+) Transcript_9807:98-799(+)|eukprot:CAMPEP_0185264286 /NCGR_PEP_ID=MMETSP1359-20130426/21596_1 /TAXON_ID=552665 /ORGANISM="Bigelowiella longifila, Strain CCMP242" /LENGTH=233 /DNA_ID=CAMNT_0027852717 /DNA_START=47 /DNA_END=748 /DNA_ORIENTATION=+
MRRWLERTKPHRFLFGSKPRCGTCALSSDEARAFDELGALLNRLGSAEAHKWDEPKLPTPLSNHEFNVFPPVFRQYLRCAERRLCPMVSDGDTMLLTHISDLVDEQPFPYYHWPSYVCISDFYNNDTIWRVYVCIRDTDLHVQDMVVEVDHWDYLIEDEEDATNGDGEPLTKWPVLEEGDDFIQSAARGEQDNDREPLVFADMIRFLQSVERYPMRRHAKNEPCDMMAWDLKS